MNRLFIRLYLDEDVDVLLGKLVRARGYDVTSVQETRRFAMTDQEQLEYAAQIEASLVTHNRVHFETLAEQWRVAGRDHAGIIIAARHKPRLLAGRLFRLLNEVTADEMINQVRYI